MYSLMDENGLSQSKEAAARHRAGREMRGRRGAEYLLRFCLDYQDSLREMLLAHGALLLRGLALT